MTKLWFKQKSYGWGWTPSTWQGWVVLGVHILGLLVASRIFLKDAPEDELSRELVYFLIWTFVQSGILIYITYKKGPKPEWRWGREK